MPVTDLTEEPRVTFTSSVLLRILGLICLVVWIVLVIAKASAGTFEEILPWTGMALWLLSTLVP